MSEKTLYWNGVSRYADYKHTYLYRAMFNEAKAGNWEPVIEGLATLELQNIPDLIPVDGIMNSIDPDSKEGNSLLHFAAHAGTELEIVKKLIEFGAFRHLRNSLQQKPLDIARQQGHKHLYQVLTPVEQSPVSLETIQRIEANFHNLIMEDGYWDVGELIQEKSLRLPQLQPLLERNKPIIWFPIPYFMGGISYFFRLNDEPIRLISHGGSRMDDQSQLFEINAEGSRIIEDDPEKRWLVHLQLEHTR